MEKQPGDRLSNALGLEDIDRPANLPTPVMGWASDAIAALLSELGFEYIALVPGASFRGLHDSIVNYSGNSNPQMLVCLHEEHAVAIAQGYAKVTDRPMLACLHSNVGLMHATMAIYDAWCDRMPIVILGATGPVDASRRRPWTDWIHTAQDQGALIRNYVKWDDQAVSVGAAIESILRARQISMTSPFGPTYVCLETEMQEEKLEEGFTLPAVVRYQPAQPAAAPESLIEKAAELLSGAERPVVLCGRVSRSQEDWDARVALCEAIGGIVLSDIRNCVAFPTNHPLHVVEPRHSPSDASVEAITKADVILSLDWLDLAGLITICERTAPVTARMISVSVDSYVHNGWSKDHQALPAVDLPIQVTPDAITRPLTKAIRQRTGERRYDAPKFSLETECPKISYSPETARSTGQRMKLREFAECVSVTLRDLPVSYTRFTLGWPGHACEFTSPLDYFGNDGGGGVGAGPGVSVGVALALRDKGRIPVAVLGDGDFLMGVNSLWTAARSRIPLMIVVGNNRTYRNDEVHQARVAGHRDRPRENRWIGQMLDDPPVDIVAIATAQGFTGEGPIERIEDLPEALLRGADVVQAGGCYIIDVMIDPDRS